MSLADIQSMKALKLAKQNANRMKLVKPATQFKLPVVMASPPTVSLSAANAASSLSNAQNTYSGISGTTNVNPLFKYYGDMYRADWNGTSYNNNYPDYNYVSNKAISGVGGGYLTGNIDVEFVVDDSAFEIMVQGKGQSTSWRILVDEGQGYQAAFSDPASYSIPNDTNQYRIIVTFSTRKLRRIRFQMAAGGFQGITTGGNGTVLPVSHTPNSKLIVMGDSFTEGTGANGWFNGYASIIGSLLGFDTWTSGQGGTGYMNPNSSLNRVKYGDRVQHDVISYKPDLVVIQGGQNDTGYAPSDVQNAAASLYQALKSGLPGVPIIAISNIAISATTTAITNTRDAIKNAALANGVALIDSIDGTTYDFNGNVLTNALGNWFTGSGNVGVSLNAWAASTAYAVNNTVTANGNVYSCTTAGTSGSTAPSGTGSSITDGTAVWSYQYSAVGNRFIYTWTDSGHPSNNGHRYIGERVASEIYKLLSLI